jgi:CHAT domain-containing protein
MMTGLLSAAEARLPDNLQGACSSHRSPRCGRKAAQVSINLTPAALRRAIVLGAAGVCLVLGLTSPAKAQAPTGQPSKAFDAAAAQARDANTLRTIVAEAQVLYQRDRVKLSGYQYCSQAVSLADRGEFRESIRAAGKALMLGQQEGDQDLQALAKRDLAIAYSYSGNLSQAEQYAREALQLPAKNPKIVAAPCKKVLGDVYARRGEYAKAQEVYESALQSASDKYRPLVQLSMANALIAADSYDQAGKLLDQIGDPGSPSLRQLLLRTRGTQKLAQGKYAEALALFQAGLKNVGGSDGAYQRLWLEDGIARAYLGVGNRAQARAAYQQAVDLADTVRAKFRSEEFKAGVFGDMQSVFEGAIALAVAEGDFAGALTISEKSRARSLLDMIRERTTASGQVSRSKDSAAVFDLGALRNALAPGEAIVEYHSLPSETVVWVVRRDGVKGTLIQRSRKDLAEAVERFRASIIDIKRASRAQGRELYDVLVRPAAIQPGERLVIVPHGPLHYLPFQALSDGESYLIQLHPITVAPSAGVALQSIAAKQAVGGQLVAFGNPDLGNAEMALPGAQREVELISGMFQNPEVFYQRDANKRQFKANAGESNVLHVAAHAQVDTVDPLYSRVLLSPGESDDGRLEAREIFDLNLSGVSLVTLSACESGLGRVAGGDEVLGFPRSFLSAGASALIVSLWPVSDESTEILMSTLYKGLRAGDSVQDAMQASQLAVLKNRKFAHPFYWAPFNLIGDWRLKLAV